MTVVVAATRSRHGGRLGCGHMAKRGEPIYKVDTGDRGRQTSGGNGRGAWICARCVMGVDTDPDDD
jgi:hypothetical protein